MSDRKLWQLLALMMVFVLALAACGGNDGDNTAANEEPATRFPLCKKGCTMWLSCMSARTMMAGGARLMT
jgi:ABC-type glycerol-3-phosphate transport system substrate-binding protein